MIEFVFEDDDGMVEEQDLESYDVVQPFAWDKNTTQLLVEQYMSLKDAFRDPKVKKKKLWTKIKNEFLSKRHHVTEDILDRKWRNLKKTYTGIKDNIRKTGRGRIYWEYYHQFNEIYREDKTVNLPTTISTSTPLSVIQKLPIKLQPLNEVGPRDLPQPSVPATPQKESSLLTP
ncbi:unnamed protein product [Ceutorhynchus assimilis]|uniref:Myb/SANT-like DNA-binding domain-containing protein n=1 Tax=Ceutorhynchus assimilis TaxID=467358 RepID=A0A9N9N1U4_9CUCU|nr:unnamed protein product [Ceutorhynchus assimilis]